MRRPSVFTSKTATRCRRRGGHPGQRRTYLVPTHSRPWCSVPRRRPWYLAPQRWKPPRRAEQVCATHRQVSTVLRSAAEVLTSNPGPCVSAQVGARPTSSWTAQTPHRALKTNAALRIERLAPHTMVRTSCSPVRCALPHVHRLVGAGSICTPSALVQTYVERRGY